MNESQELIPVPGRLTGEPLPCSAFQDGHADDCQQLVIEFLDLRIGRFFRSPDEMGRNALLAAFELPLVEEAQAGNRISDHCGSLVNRQDQR